MKNLQGKRILNTRPLPQGKAWSKFIEKAGGTVFEFPLLEIKPIDWELGSLENIDIVIFISANAVHYFFEGLAANPIVWPNTIQVLSIGQATTKALSAYNIEVLATPTIENSEHLLELPCLHFVQDKNILLVKGLHGRKYIQDTLESRSAIVKLLSVYERCLPTYDPQYIKSIWLNNAIDIILLTSESALENLFCLFSEKDAREWLLKKTFWVISERVAKKAQLLGLTKPEIIQNATFAF